MNKGKNNAIDWIRVISCIGIMAMHVRVNLPYDIPNDSFNLIVNSFSCFIYLFMAISSFGLCCGYYQSFVDGSINWETFYKRRFTKILPFFITMILLDLCVSFSFDSLMQGLVEATLFHGFVPVKFTVIGVGWFLGLVFIFYLSFPFFCVLYKNKKTGWIAFLIALGLNLICKYHFHLEFDNFAHSFCFFCIGGLIYLYKDRIESTKWWYFVILIIPAVAVFYLRSNTIICVLLTALILAFAVSLKIQPFKPVKLLSSISMEIYLCHMVVYRVLEKMHFFDVIGGGIAQYIITCIVVFIGACIMSVIVKYVLGKLFMFVNKLHPIKYSESREY